MPYRTSNNAFDPDLREYHQHMALSAIGNRTSKRPLPRASTSKALNTKQPVETNDDEITRPLFYDSGDDEELAFAIQASLEHTHDKSVASNAQTSHDKSTSSSSVANVSGGHPSAPKATMPLRSSSSSEHDSIFTSPNRLETALSIANAGPSRTQVYSSLSSPKSISFGHPLLLSSQTRPITAPEPIKYSSDISSSTILASNQHNTTSGSAVNLTTVDSNNSTRVTIEQRDVRQVTGNAALTLDSTQAESYMSSESEDDMEEVMPVFDIDQETASTPLPLALKIISRPSTPPLVEDNVEETTIHWSRSPSPNTLPSMDAGVPSTDDSVEDDRGMDLVAEEGEFARFISEVKGKDIEDVRREIDDEIKFLNQQRKAAMRDSEDITQQMISQIMVCSLIIFSCALC